MCVTNERPTRCGSIVARQQHYATAAETHIIENMSLIADAVVGERDGAHFVALWLLSCYVVLPALRFVLLHAVQAAASSSSRVIFSLHIQ